MTIHNLPKYRIHTQQLLNTQFSTPAEMVRYFGAMQAQDYAMAKWAVGIRLGARESTIENALASGDIIRTHILRPTWHFVAAEDIRWMLKLTAPHVKRIAAPMNKRHDLDEKTLHRFNEIIAKSLSGNKHLTREEIMQELQLKTDTANDIRPTLISMNAELDGIICSGAMRGKQITYSLLDERVPNSPALSHEEALVALSKKYFTSHGPATVNDFAWWSGLSIANSKLAIELIKPDFQSINIDNQTYLFDPTLHRTIDESNIIHFLPAFDEFLISYKDRTASIALDNQPKAFSKNGIFYPVISINGKAVGTWKRTLKKDTAIIQTQFFNQKQIPLTDAFFKAAEQYGNYIGKKTIVH